MEQETVSPEVTTAPIVPVETPVTTPPDEEAARKFTMLLPYVSKLGSALNAKGVVRVLHAFAEFPLGATKPRLLNDAERQLFHVLQELQGHKSTVIQSIMKKQMDLEQAQKTAAELPVAETDGTNGGN